MKIDRVKLDLSIVAGILLLVIVSILLGFALVGGSLIDSNSMKSPINLDYKKSQINLTEVDPYLSESNSIVSVAQCGCWLMDTVQGSITIIEPTVLPDVLELCITQEYLDNYVITVEVKGGYEPVDFGSTLTLCQKGEYKGTINVEWSNADPEVVSCVEVWTGLLKLPDPETPIILDSNQYPDGVCHPDEYDTIPGKKVFVSGVSEWTGCGDLNQHFKYIQIHQLIASPQLPMRFLISLIAS